MFVIGIALILFSCNYDHLVPISKEPILPETVSFQRDIIPIFNKYCNTSGCHSGSSPTGNLNLEPAVAYSQLIKKQEVDTINPTYSAIYIKMTSASNPMPPTGKLDNYTISIILKWIRQKAKNN